MPGRGRWVCLDVGETLIDESRVWSTWADIAGVPRLTFMAVLGAAIASGGAHEDFFTRLGVGDWLAAAPIVETDYGGFREEDLYPDARQAIGGLRALGYRVAVIGNQPASRGPELRALGIEPDVMAMSDEMGVSKPDPAFFARALELMGSPDPGDVAYVGDRIDNDVQPSAAAGMRAVWIRRGPWAAIQGTELPLDRPPELTVADLDELVERIGEAW